MMLRSILGAVSRSTTSKLATFRELVSESQQRKIVLDAVLNRAVSTALETQAFNDLLADAIFQGRPFLVARPGTVELSICNEYLQRRHLRTRPRPYTEKLFKYLRRVLEDGFPWYSADDLDGFAVEYCRDIVRADAVVFWDQLVLGHDLLLDGRAVFVNLGSLDPIAVHLDGFSPWTRALEGKTVLIVHPFEKSIREQHARRSTISVVKDHVPDFDLVVLQPPQFYAGWISAEKKPWAHHLRDVTSAIAEQKFDVAIVGAGPFGLPIASFIRDMGKTAIHLGGTTQLLFGIRGKRWDDLQWLGHLFDDTWIRPHASETPPRAALYENSPYW